MYDDKAVYASLPSIGDLNQETREKVTKLLEDLDDVTSVKAKLIVQEDDLKDELERLQEETGRSGFRHGNLIFYSQPVKGRKTLDKLLLIENGCPASVLNASYKEGAPTIRNTFKHLPEEEV